MKKLKSNSEYKSILKQINRNLEYMDVGLEMDNEMDGSGECSGIIHDSWVRWFRSQLASILWRHRISFKELLELCKKWGELELEKGPKEVWVFLYSKKDGTYMHIDFTDTKYGLMHMELTMLLNK